MKYTTKTIAFTWNSNTWKTTAVQDMLKYYTEAWYKVKVLWETAREYIDQFWEITDLKKFEQFIANKEIERIEELIWLLARNEYDYIFVDRTSLDICIYSYWNMISWNLENIDYLDNYQRVLRRSNILYDFVVLFDTPIKTDSRFDIYNNDSINQMFKLSINYFYWDRVITFTNNIEFSERFSESLFANKK